MGRAEITFRELIPGDMEKLHFWLNQDFIAATYCEEPRSLEDIRARYMPMVLGLDPAFPYIFQIDGVDAGYIQTYMIDDHPEYAEQIKVEPKTAGVDLYIGERSFIHRGYGPIVLREFLETIVFAKLPATSCVIGPAVTNKPAIRAYEKAGFRYLKTVDIPGEPEPEYIMVIEKRDLFPE